MLILKTRVNTMTRLLRGALLMGALVGAAGCESTLPLLVGEKGGKNVTAATSVTVAPPPDTAFLSDSDLMPGYTSQSIVPPTLAFDSDAAPPPAPDSASSGPRRPIAVAPLSSDPAALAGLSQAANKGPGAAGAKFVLLVLTPPGTDAASLDSSNAAARAAAAAAVAALGNGGVTADRIDISLATNPDVGKGEMRLYRR